jgi:hypothetical protein
VGIIGERREARSTCWRRRGHLQRHRRRFTDLSADRAQGVFGASYSILQFRRMRKTESCSARTTKAMRGPAIYNSSFRPFHSPVPFLFVRHGVTSDWKFFLDNEEWLNLWAHRYGESGTQALAEELRRLPWRATA